MQLKMSLWADEACSSPSSSADVRNLVSFLNSQRSKREIMLGLRTSLRDSCAEFSSIRVRGLRGILKLLHSVAESDSSISLFHNTQLLAEFQVVPVLFRNSLAEAKGDPVVNLNCIFSPEPVSITNSASDSEVVLALRVLEGCCLLSRECVALAHQYKAVEVLLGAIWARGSGVRGACLDALLSVLIGSSACLTVPDSHIHATLLVDGEVNLTWDSYMMLWRGLKEHLYIFS